MQIDEEVVRNGLAWLAENFLMPSINVAIEISLNTEPFISVLCSIIILLNDN